MTNPRDPDRLLEVEDYLVLAPLLLLPWAFGGVEIWAHRSAALLLVAAACVSLWKRGPEGWGLRKGSGWLWPALLLAAWGAIQVVPMPSAMMRTVSPAAHDLYVEAFPGYQDAAAGEPLAALERRAIEAVHEAAPWPTPEGPSPEVVISAPSCLDDRWRTISLEPGATRERLAWYVALLLGFLVMRERVRSRERFRAYRAALFGLFGLLAAFALVQMQFWNGKVYWVRTVLTQASPFGPYMNPTNLAGVMELAVPALAGVIWARLRRQGRSAVYEAGLGAAAVAGAFCLIAGFTAASKLAALLLVLGLTALGVLAARTWRARAGVLAALAVLVGGGVLLLAETRLGERTQFFLERSQDLAILEGRLVVWQYGLQMFRDFPLTGTGFGSFAEAFARYLPAGARNRWAHAHNDYVELLLEGGLVAAALVLWLMVGYGRRVVSSLRRARIVSPSRIGLAIGVVSLAAHACFDFNHQVPADGMLWVACCALLLPGDRRRRSRGDA